jgi:hypothetical protein
MRLSSSTLWLVIPALLLLALVLQLSPSGGTIQAAEPSTPRAGATPYVSSDPSVPPAASVQFPEPTPHIEAF